MASKKENKAWLERLKFYAQGLTTAQKKELIDFTEYKVWQAKKEQFDSIR